MTTEVKPVTRRLTARSRLGIVDCDLHLQAPSTDALTERLSRRWAEYHAMYGQRTYERDYYPRPTPGAARTDLEPPPEMVGGTSNMDFLREHHLDAWDIAVGIITPLSYHSLCLNLDYGAAMARAVNEWQADACDEEPRLRGSLVVAAEDPGAAVKELEHWAGDPRFVQVFLLAGTNEPAGSRKYWTLYEAAAAQGLPVGFHFGALGPNPPTGTGYPSTYLENHAGAPVMFQDHVASLVCEGCFERVPELKVVLIEGGFAWLAPLMWRLDGAWRRLRSEVPELRQLPSEYIQQHVWATTQPMEEPPNQTQFLGLLEQLGMDEHLMFATDYPHWDFDSPDVALPSRVPQELKQLIMGDNARALYRLGPRA
jgi:uncharacterized protein